MEEILENCLKVCFLIIMELYFFKEFFDCLLRYIYLVIIAQDYLFMFVEIKNSTGYYLYSWCLNLIFFYSNDKKEDFLYPGCLSFILQISQKITSSEINHRHHSIALTVVAPEGPWNAKKKRFHHRRLLRTL